MFLPRTSVKGAVEVTIASKNTNVFKFYLDKRNRTQQSLKKPLIQKNTYGNPKETPLSSYSLP